jgi:queuine/archaeosine tRNA-ribosyltransferase
MMVLDVCSPTTNNTKDKTYQQMQLTHRWAKEQFEYFEQHYNSAR